MQADIRDRKFETWRHGLLDLSKRNRLVNYRKTKRMTLTIVSPSMENLYSRLVMDGDTLSFRRQIDPGDNLHLSQLFYIMDKMGAPVDLSEGEVRSDLSSAEMMQTLKALRSRARISQEEQGINTLYLSCGFLQWKQRASNAYILSPLVLVPVSLELESFHSPYTIKRLDEDIVINPTLEYVLSSDYGIELPDFDPQSASIEEFLDNTNAMVAPMGWSVIKETNLGLVSFLKIVMYKDLEKYKTRIFSNPVIQAFCGDSSALPALDESLLKYSHDLTPALDSCQVVSADASQQDAILLSRKGLSFVLQGPPGTGKSQTITNIIAQALADGKKVLFVSEKMAALSVVHRRLEEVSLAEYCLSLHNYKADKKSVIRDLINTLDAPIRNVRPGSITPLYLLENERAQLNKYVEEIDKVRTPINKSLYAVITELSSDSDGCVYDIEGDVLAVSDIELHNRLQCLQMLQAYFTQNGQEIYNNPWRDTSISVISYDVRNMVSKRLGKLRVFLSDLSKLLSTFNGKYNLSHEWNYYDFRALINVLSRTYLTEHFVEHVCSLSHQSSLFDESYTQLTELDTHLAGATSAAADFGIGSEIYSSPAAVDEELIRCQEIRDTVVFCSQLVQKLNRCLPVHIRDTFVGLQQGKKFLKLTSIPHVILGQWFEPGSYSVVVDKVKQWMQLGDAVAEVEARISASWNPGFFDVNSEAMLYRFKTDYTSFFGRLKSQYRADREKLKSYRKESSSPPSNEVYIQSLQDLEEYKAKKQDFSKATTEAPSLIALLGSYNKGLDTDWRELLHVLADCAIIQEYFNEYGLSDAALLFLERPYAERQSAILSLCGDSGLESLYAQLEEAIRRSEAFGQETFTQQLALLDKRINCLVDIKNAYRELEEFIDSFKRGGENLDSLSAKRILLSNIKQLKIRVNFNRIFNTMQLASLGLTDIDIAECEGIFSEYIDNDKAAEEVEKISSRFPAITDQEFEIWITQTTKLIQRSIDQEDTLRCFDDWFPKMDTLAVPLDSLSEHISQCSSVGTLQQWLNYASICEKCSAAGIGNYLEQIENQHTPPEDIVRIYYRSFLTRWVTDLLAINNIAQLQNFQASSHENTITDFKENDKKQFKIAQARLLEKLSHEKPSGITQLATARDEVSILRHEGEKKRNIIPLRKLFKTIPTLLQKLKPCFMMSPLSVSYFLDSEMYQFDLVIFDEASQILPEDAIGSIYRGKQVIIAGDTKQMPPTSFFSAISKIDGEADVDDDSDEYYPDIVSESILDEANICLPSCTLLWHYRSKDEALISFSNQQLYNGNLITFPNPAPLKDRGVEYVFVPNGYYEGSGKNCNIMEAKKCLALVIDHIVHHPDRSLGIIAFSEKQQSVIEEVINDFRTNNPQYEDFFDEAKDEPFFVKNLENVQGDERDTIIFSICYAKNMQGRMYQRFGPLGHDGGERRLNVAITRAKYNVKLVGSIMPADIIIREGTKAGIRMLRDYIYYAMQNDFRLTYSGSGAGSDSFVDIVTEAIESVGYSCKQNVGASRYKIDIAVQSQDRPDVFIAGIECDSSNYTNARTAHDRDVLRREILMSFGWNLYHVWSMAWYLDPEGEKKRLIDFIERCANSIPEELSGEDDSTSQPYDSEIEYAEDLTDSISMEGTIKTVDFAPYVYADPWEAHWSNSDDGFTIIQKAVLYVMEREQPIHKEELYRRLATIFGKGRVSTGIRVTVDYCIRERLSTRVILRNDFYYLAGAIITARAPTGSVAPRPIDYISPEEIEDGMCKVLEFAYGITSKELINETARQFGFARTGQKITEILDNCLKSLISCKKIKETDGKLYHTRGGS